MRRCSVPADPRPIPSMAELGHNRPQRQRIPAADPGKTTSSRLLFETAGCDRTHTLEACTEMPHNKVLQRKRILRELRFLAFRPLR